MKAAVLTQATFASSPVISSSSLSAASAEALNDSVSSSSSSDTSDTSSSVSSACALLQMSLEREESDSREEKQRDQNFTSENILKSTHHPFTINNASAYTSYFYTNTITILNKFVMSYEEQLHKAIDKGNYELCNELILRKCDVNAQFNNKFPLCLACRNNFADIAQLLIKVSLS